MANMFDKFASERVMQQEAIETQVMGETSAVQDAGVARTTMSLSLSVDDKVKLKTVAAKRNMTVARLVHEWVASLEE